MEKSLAKTDQIRANAAAVTAINTAIPARRAVSASRSGAIGAGWPVANSLNATMPAKRLYAASAKAMRRERLPNVAIRAPSLILALRTNALGESNELILNHFRLVKCDLPHTRDG